MKGNKTLVPGNGIVAKPCVDYLLRSDANILKVACRTLSMAEMVVAARHCAKAIALDVTSPELDRHIAEHGLVISLVFFTHHTDIIRSAIKGKTDVVTMSYVSPAMRELAEAAKEAGITVLNDVGMDPVINHLYAINTIGEVHDKGGKVKEFYSFCGGPPAPEGSDNPLRFKFSWSPRGAHLSWYNSATFLRDGKVVEIPNKYLMAEAKPYHVLDGYSFLAYPNRDPVLFREAYGIPEAHTVIWGSLRYEGNPALVKASIDLGWIDTETPWLKDGLTWAQIQKQATGVESTAELDLISRVDQLCTFPPLTNNTITTPLEPFGELDGYSAISKSVGVTCGIATRLLLNEFAPLNNPGVWAPYSSEICDVIPV
ncbi:hypothetical protein FNYG_11492 [Fusarium nygamai]|uniref:Saccharopine dehydrogenase NADP binding domain-containing protein n=1 Tax=Gibberella nygamai TaxID=42673 RepID=A0A2K0VYS4_GIBNY|nr:hypothetical protein FNYG_11492 [Fusarium nygamai]